VISPILEWEGGWRVAPEGVTYFNLFLSNDNTQKFFWGAAFQRGYGCSISKSDIPHPQVQETFPDFFVEIG